jgi:hypothetical protein
VSRTAVAIREIPDVERHLRPVSRVSTEYFLRSYDSLTRVQEDAIDGEILVTLLHAQMTAPHPRSISIRELSRRLGLPYETVRRHAQGLVRGGQCSRASGGLVVPGSVQRTRCVTVFLRTIYVNTIRFLVDLTRVGVAAFPSASRRALPSGRFTKEQMTIALAGAGLLLAGVRLSRDFWKGDLTKGLVFNAIWTANVKHVTNTSRAATASVLADDQRLAVSALGISRSLRLPYETVRRHADALVREGFCVRAGRQGILVPASTHRQRTESGGVDTYRLVMEFLAELRNAGVEV